MSNPYTPGVPVEPIEFAGREKEIRTITAHALSSAGGQPANVFIQGEWGIGKASLLRRLELDLSEHGCVIRAKVQKDAEDHFELLIRSIVQGILTQAGCSDDILSEQSLLKGMDRLVNDLAKVYEAIKPRFEHVVILIDETDEASPRTLRDLRDVFQDLYEKRCRFMLVATGTELPVSDTSARNPVRRFFHFTKLGPLSFDECPTAVRKPLLYGQRISYRGGEQSNLRPSDSQGVFEFTDDGIQELFEKSEGHPYFLKLLCHHVYDAADGKGSIDRAWLADHWNDITVRLNKDKFDAEFNNLPDGEQKVLLKASFLESDVFRRRDLGNIKSVDTYLTRLKRDGLLHSVRHGEYEFYHPLFRESVRARAIRSRMKPPKSNYLPQGEPVTARFKLQDWIQENVSKWLWILDQHFRGRTVSFLEAVPDGATIRVLMGRDEAWSKTEKLIKEELPPQVRRRLEVRAWPESQENPVPFHIRLLISDSSTIEVSHSLDGLGKKAATMTDQGPTRQRLIQEFKKWWALSEKLYPAEKRGQS